MSSKEDGLRMSGEATGYLDSYPAFRETRGERINDRFFDGYMSGAAIDAAGYRSAVRELDGRTTDTAAAEAPSRRTGPGRREFEGIDGSGFFRGDSAILDGGEDFAA